MSRSSPAVFPNVAAGAGTSAGPDNVWKTPFDNIESGAEAVTVTVTGKAGVCENALRVYLICGQKMADNSVDIQYYSATC